MTTRKTKVKPEAETTAIEPKKETQISNRTPDVIAAEIRSIDQQARQYVLQSAIEIGRKLTEAKDIVSHGEWGEWLKSNVNYSQSTANNFMRVASEYSNSQTLANLSYSQAVALLSVPSDERETFVTENNAFEMSTRELQAAIKEKQELEKQLADERKRIEEDQETLEQERQQRAELQLEYEREMEMRKKFQDELIAAQEAADKEPAAKGTAESKAKAAELRKAEKALSESQQRITSLEDEMKAKEDEINAKIDAAVKAREKEIAAQARAREEEASKTIAELQDQLRKNNNTTAIKVKVHFDAVVGNFKELVSSLSTLENEEQKKAISDRVAAFCDEMKAKL